MTDNSTFDQRLALLHTLLDQAPSLTRVLRWWTGQDVTIQILEARRRMLHIEEYVTLGGRGHDDMTGHERIGMLRTQRGDRNVLALTRVLVLPDRIPESVRLATGIPHPGHPEITRSTGVPLGQALTDLGETWRRVDTTVWSMIGHVDASDGDRLAIGCRSTLIVGDQPAGITGEELTCETITQFTPPGGLADFLLADATASPRPCRA